MYRIMYRFSHMKRSESAVTWSEEAQDLVEARFPSREAAKPMLEEMKASCLGTDLADIRIEKIRVR